MSLFDIKNKLYKNEEEKKNQEPLVDFEYSQKMDGVPDEKKQAKELWEPQQTKFSERTRLILKIGFLAMGGLIILSAAGWGIYKYRQSAFNNERVSVLVAGPNEIRSGKEMSWEISWKNDNRIDLESAVLKFNYPENFKPGNMDGFTAESPTSGTVKLGKVEGHTGSKFTFSGKTFNPKGALIYIQAELIYTASNFNSRFTAQNRLGVTVASSPIILDVNYPQSVSNGDEVQYEIIYSNTGEENFSNVKLETAYPDDFQFISSDPAFSGSNNQWHIGDLNAGNIGRIFIKGRLNGERNEVKELKIFIKYFENGDEVILNEENAEIKIVGSPLYIGQTINKPLKEGVFAGETIKFDIFYRNDGDIGFRDVIVTERLVGDALNFSTLKLPGGNYDSGTHTITWKAVDFPALKNLGPGESGTISFTIKVKDPLPVQNDKNKNFIFYSLAKIDSQDIPTPIAMNKIISSNSINVKVNSQMGISVAGFYKDETIPNSGPIPPLVDQETTYTLHWTVSNYSNDLEDAKVEASLPTGVTMTGNIAPSGENIKYNERTNSLIWEIGKLESGTGVIKSARTVAFQVKIKPSIDLMGKTPVLLEKSYFTGKDTFTGQNLKVQAEKKDTNLEEDKSIGTNGGRVL